MERSTNSSRRSSKPTRPSGSPWPEPEPRLDRPHRTNARAWGCQQLKEANVESCILDTDLLLAGALRVARIDLHVNRDSFLTDEQTRRYEDFIQRRSRGEPVDYVLGRREFMGLEFKVDRRVLVPRPSTEVLVEKALQYAGVEVRGGELRPDPRYDPLVMDVGTGCGAAAIAIAYFLPSARVIASDISTDAVAVARQNASALGMTATADFVVADLQPATIPPPDILIANLPYVPTGEIPRLQREVRDFEPRLALDGGPDGFALYRRLLQTATVSPGSAMLIEIGFDQTDLVRSAASLRSADLRVEIFPDLEGMDRIALITGWS